MVDGAGNVHVVSRATIPSARVGRSHRIRLPQARRLAFFSNDDPLQHDGASAARRCCKRSLSSSS